MAREERRPVTGKPIARGKLNKTRLQLSGMSPPRRPRPIRLGPRLAVRRSASACTSDHVTPTGWWSRRRLYHPFVR
jgi:hypothetical protein